MTALIIIIALTIWPLIGYYTIGYVCKTRKGYEETLQFYGFLEVIIFYILLLVWPILLLWLIKATLSKNLQYFLTKKEFKFYETKERL